MAEVADVEGPLAGVRVIEMGGMGAAAFSAMLLADLGADVIRVDQVSSAPVEYAASSVSFLRGRRSVAIDLQKVLGVETVLALVEEADGLIEGYGPGVMERLHLGPGAASARNPRLVYARLSGWGQDGSYAKVAGHDINHVALSGALEPIGDPESPPVPPLNLVGLGGGAMLGALGLVSGVLAARRDGEGQVIDAAVIDGAALLTTMFHGLRATGAWVDRRGSNALDGGSHFYGVYETADNEFISVGAIEPKFYEELLRLTGLTDVDVSAQRDRESWPGMKQRLTAVFRSKTQQEWCDIMEKGDACFAPVLSLESAPRHPHNRYRGTFVSSDGVIQPAVAPRFSRTPGHVQRPPAWIGEHTETVLRDWGIETSTIERLRESGVIGSRPERARTLP